MAIVITNGKLYMYLNEYGKHRKTDDITKAIQYKSKGEAVSYMYKAPSKTKGFYVYDTTDNIVLWERKNNGADNIKRNKNGKIKRKKYSKSARKLIYNKANGCCQLCGRKITFEQMTVDHIIPLVMNGVDDVSNLQCTCEVCNKFKGAILPEDFLNRITTIFMYQMDKKNKHKLLWKITYNMLERMI